MVSVNALELSEYGGWMINDSFEFDRTLASYPYNVKYSTSNTVSTDNLISYGNVARTGDRSIKLSFILLDEGDSLGFLRTLHGAGLDYVNERTYISYYVKGTNLTKSDIGMEFTYLKNGNANRVDAPYDAYGIEDADANGWFKVWYIVPAIHNYNINESGLVGPQFKKRSGGATAIYIDDFKVCHLPEKIEFKQRNIPYGKAFNLDKMQATAYNKNGYMEDLPNAKITQWEVVDGDARIDGRNLIPGKDTEITLKGTFFDVSDEVTLYTTSNVSQPVLKSDLSAGTITEADGTYSVTVSNAGDGNGKATLIAAVYKDGRLDRTYTVSGKILPGQSKALEIENISKSETDTVKLMVWDGIFGCIAIK